MLFHIQPRKIPTEPEVARWMLRGMDWAFDVLERITSNEIVLPDDNIIAIKNNINRLQNIITEQQRLKNKYGK